MTVSDNNTVERLMMALEGVRAWPRMGYHDDTPTVTEASKVAQALLPTIRELQAGALERFGRNVYSLDPPAGMWQDAVWKAATDEAATYRSPQATTEAGE